MSASALPAFDLAAEKAVLGSLLLMGDARTVAGLMTRGLRPEHFYYDQHRVLFTAAVSLCDRQAEVDPITLAAELDRLGLRGKISREQIDELAGHVPAAGHRGQYADRVMEMARWRKRSAASVRMMDAAGRRDTEAWSQAQGDLDSTGAGARTDSLSAEQWASLMYEYFAAQPEEIAKQAIPFPIGRINDALGGGLRPGEVCVIGGPSFHGKSIVADMWADHAAKYGKRGHIYLTEMTFVGRGMRYLARQTGVPFKRQRRPDKLSEDDRRKILAALPRFDYGVSIVADWDVDDIVRDALRARYDWIVVDLLHGWNYADERELDRLSKAMQRLARVSTTLDGHLGTAVIAVAHLKEEGAKGGQVPRPTVSSIKGGSSIRQDADFVMFVWQKQDSDGTPTGDGEIWVPKARSGEPERVEIRLQPSRFVFALRADEELPVDGDTPVTGKPEKDLF